MEKAALVGQGSTGERPVLLVIVHDFSSPPSTNARFRLSQPSHPRARPVRRGEDDLVVQRVHRAGLLRHYQPVCRPSAFASENRLYPSWIGATGLVAYGGQWRTPTPRRRMDRRRLSTKGRHGTSSVVVKSDGEREEVLIGAGAWVVGYNRISSTTADRGQQTAAGDSLSRSMTCRPSS